MKALIPLFLAGCLSGVTLQAGAQASGSEGAGQGNSRLVKASPPIGTPGRLARYDAVNAGLPASVVKTYTLALGPVEQAEGLEHQWVLLHATKANGEEYRVWWLSAAYPPPTIDAARPLTARYLLQEGVSEPVEFREPFTGKAVLPTMVGFLWPRASSGSSAVPAREVFPLETSYLGHRYRLDRQEDTSISVEPPSARRIELSPDFWVGLPSNTRQKDETRRYDDSDYELVRLTQEDYRELVQAGFNCLRVDARQLPWVQGLNAFYWGVGGSDVAYPECLYRSSYLGPALFLDEPAVGTRDHVIRPRLARDESFRKTISPQAVFDAFQEHFLEVCQKGAPASLRQGLAARGDVDPGDMDLRQANLFSWETMVCSAAYQLSQDPRVPTAMVFEPPGRVGTRRTLPELNMTYGCQLPADDPKNLIDLIYGCLRGAARLTGKSWGTSIYGSVDRADAPWFLTHAYDLGATRFFFWDSYRLACVPYGECLALARHLRAHAESHPRRDLPRLLQAAETALLLPPGYNLGHVHLGKGSLWGLPELNLERRNQAGVTYRQVMSGFFTEIERCLRLGVAFDVLWDLPGIRRAGYREVVRIREDGKVEVEQEGKRQVLEGARVPARPPGLPPELRVSLSSEAGKAPLEITARAEVAEKSAPVYYTLGTDREGVYRNAVVAWELYGPGEEDYRLLLAPGFKPAVQSEGPRYEVVVRFRIERPGHYRLRAATVDLAGRSTVRWTPITVAQ